MLSCLSDEDIARLIKEDIPYLDLTTYGLQIGRRRGTLEFYTRHPVIACGTEEAAGVLGKLGADVRFVLESGTPSATDQLLLKAEGNAEALHAGWRIALNLMEYSSGMATRTAGLVKAAREVNADASVVATRKVFPGTRAIMVKAIVAGGALPHRLGLSETILIFRQHTVFVGDFTELTERIVVFKKRFQGHKVSVEVESTADGWKLAETGAVDIIQMDKIPLQELTTFVPAFKARHPTILVAAAGGINIDNIKDYAAIGVDLLVTSWLYFGKPADIAARMTPAGE